MQAPDEKLWAVLPELEKSSLAAAELVLRICPQCLTNVELQASQRVPTVEELLQKVFRTDKRQPSPFLEAVITVESPGEITLRITSSSGGYRPHYVELDLKRRPAENWEFYAEEIETAELEALVADLVNESRGLYMAYETGRRASAGMIKLPEMNIAPLPGNLPWLRRPSRPMQVQVFSWNGTFDRILEMEV